MQAGLVDRAPNAGCALPSPPGQGPLIHAEVAGVAAVAGEHRRRRLVSVQGREGGRRGREVCSWLDLEKLLDFITFWLYILFYIIAKLEF